MISPTIAMRVVRVPITIPGSGSTAVTLLSLVESAIGDEKRRLIGGRVNPTTADYNAGDSASSLPVLVSALNSYSEPAANFLEATYVKAVGAGSISASVSVWLRW